MSSYKKRVDELLSVESINPSDLVVLDQPTVKNVITEENGVTRRATVQQLSKRVRDDVYFQTVSTGALRFMRYGRLVIITGVTPASTVTGNWETLATIPDAFPPPLYETSTCGGYCTNGEDHAKEVKIIAGSRNIQVYSYVLTSNRFNLTYICASDAN